MSLLFAFFWGGVTMDWAKRAMVSFLAGMSLALVLCLFLLAIVWLNARYPPHRRLAEHIVALR